MPNLEIDLEVAEFNEEQALEDIKDIDWSNKITDGIGEEEE